MMSFLGEIGKEKGPESDDPGPFEECGVVMFIDPQNTANRSCGCCSASQTNADFDIDPLG